MADGNTPKRPPVGGKRMVSVEERLGPLWTASPDPTTGRIRTLKEARDALVLPTSRADDVLRAMGKPAHFAHKAFPVSDPDYPERVAEFAVLHVFTRKRGRLAPLEQTDPLPMRATSNALWVVYGSIILAAHGSLVIDTLNIAPAFPGQMADSRDDPALGITVDLLRLVSPARILNDTVERLQHDGYWIDVIANSEGRTMSDTQRALLDSIAEAPRAAAPIRDEQLAELAKRYITLCQIGMRNPRSQLAREFGISSTQARDRIHKARRDGYLTPGQQGRATAGIGPRLKKQGWTAPTLAPRIHGPRPADDTTTSPRPRVP